jgi:plastocyanin
MRRTIILRGATFALALAAGVTLLLANDEVRGQTTVNVDVGDVYFCNASFAGGVCDTPISAGDTVTWNWVGSLPHTVTQCDATFATCPPPGGFDSGTMTGAGSTFSQTFNTPGTFPYQCNIHGAGMRGRVIVAAAQTTPTASAGPTQPAQTGTGAPSASISPSVTGTTQGPTPAAVPGTGGSESHGGLSWPLVLAIATGVVLVVSAGAGISMLRRR